jgi:hypothetical protein
MLKTLAFAIAIVALAGAASAGINFPNGTSLNGIATGAVLNGQIVGIELPAGTGEPSNR